MKIDRRSILKSLLLSPVPAIRPDETSCAGCHKTYIGDWRGESGRVVCTSCRVEFKGPADAQRHSCSGSRRWQQNQRRRSSDPATEAGSQPKEDLDAQGERGR